MITEQVVRRFGGLAGAAGLICLGVIAAASAARAAPPEAIARVRADAEQLSLRVGPRPHGSDAEARAAELMRDRLQQLGWSPTPVERPANQVACRGPGKRLFLAHIDSVPGSPGLIDNAAGVAALLEIARWAPPDIDLCLAFPDGEERGLLGSKLMAKAWPTDPAALELVVALDLVGQGNLGQMGLGHTWSDARIAWAHEATGGRLTAPVVHRLYSRLLPHMERSDHAPFSRRGAPGMLLFGMGRGEVFPRYHQPSDRPDLPPDPLEDGAIEALLDALMGLASAPAPPADAAPSWVSGLSLQLGRRVLPAWGSALALALVAAGVATALIRPGRGRAMRGAAWSLLGTLGLGLLGWGLSYGAFGLLAPRLGAAGLALPIDEAERTAEAVMGTPASGWWVAAPFFSGGLFVALLGLRRALRTRVVGPGPAALLGGLVCVGTFSVDPLIGVIFGSGALAARAHPLLGAAPALLLLRPDALRQLSFHGLLPPQHWGLLLLLAGLGLAARRPSAARVDAAPAPPAAAGHPPGPPPRG